MSTDTDWAQPGADAVILQPDPRVSLLAKKVTIDRVLKRVVVTSEGSRFRRETMTYRMGGTWGHDVRLVPPTTPRSPRPAARSASAGCSVARMRPPSRTAGERSAPATSPERGRNSQTTRRAPHEHTAAP